jgi:hypothetical protein
LSQRRAASVLLVGLIALCAAAFARTEQLKLIKSPVAKPHIKQRFSPTCRDAPNCRTTATLQFTLRSPQVVGLTIVDMDGHTVRTLSADRRRPKGVVRLRWDGRDGKGQVVPDGRYELAVHLVSDDRTITIPSPIVVDTRPPGVEITRVVRVPGDVKIHFLPSEPARMYRIVSGGSGPPVTERTRPTITRITLDAFAPGSYVVAIVAEDAAGNRTISPPTVRFRVP